MSLKRDRKSHGTLLKSSFIDVLWLITKPSLNRFPAHLFCNRFFQIWQGISERDIDKVE